MDSNQEGQELKAKLYEIFGGDQEISLLIDEFYYRMLMDKDLRDIFLKADMGRIRYHQKNFFSTLLGSDAQYRGRDLESVHRFLGITNEQFDKFKVHLTKILVELKKPDDLCEHILKVIESKRNVVVFPEQLLNPHNQECPIQEVQPPVPNKEEKVDQKRGSKSSKKH